MEVFRNVSEGPYALGKAWSEEVVSHTSIGSCVIWERVNQRPASRNTGVTCHQGDVLVELPSNVPGYDDRCGAGGSPDGQAITHPFVEDVAPQNKHRAVYCNVVSSVDLTDIAEMVGESIIAIKSIEISKLGIIVEPQRKGHLRVLRSSPNNNSILVAIGNPLFALAGRWLGGRIC